MSQYPLFSTYTDNKQDAVIMEVVNTLMLKEQQFNRQTNQADREGQRGVIMAIDSDSLTTNNVGSDDNCAYCKQKMIVESLAPDNDGDSYMNEVEERLEWTHFDRENPRLNMITVNNQDCLYGGDRDTDIIDLTPDNFCVGDYLQMEVKIGNLYML